MDGGYQKIPELFDYNKPAIEEYHTSSASKKDIPAAVLYEILNAADWAQTRQIARNPEKYYEKDFANNGSSEFIGSHPSTGKVNGWHLLKAVGQPYIASKLPEPYRSLFQSVSLGMAGSTVKNNVTLGLDAVRW
jgi:hypothetical protein